MAGKQGDNTRPLAVAWYAQRKLKFGCGPSELSVSSLQPWAPGCIVRRRPRGIVSYRESVPVSILTVLGYAYSRCRIHITVIDIVVILPPVLLPAISFPGELVAPLVRFLWR